MTDLDTSKQNTALQPSISGGKHDYSINGLDDFLSLVFHTDMEADENILCWMTSGVPNYPLNDAEFLKKIGRVPLPKALYFGTSTCSPDPRDGKLYNRKSLFTGLYVVVLDDIGTKVPHDSLPEGLEPTYIIESSEGNFQWGFVLDEPITNIEHAEALIQLVFDSGYTDKGGKMPTKLVRLPDGVNGKQGERGEFHVKLIKDDGKYWTPDALLKALEVSTLWAAVLEDTDEAIKNRPSTKSNLTAWSPITPNSPSLAGVIDPVLEWLYDKNMVKQETNDWVTIMCPWADQHTSGSNLAGYSPIGRGDSEVNRSRRGFKCFHGHCEAQKTGDFLQWVSASTGPHAAVTEEAHELVMNYAYDPMDDNVWRVGGVDHPIPISIRAFGNLHPRSVYAYDGGDKAKPVKEVELWRQSPARVTVWGKAFDPSTKARIIPVGDKLRINTYSPPDWGAGNIDQRHVKKFTDFIDYLIPDEESRAYFMDWIAAKAQNMGFRGAAIIMIAPAQGTGRTTLSGMLSTLFKPYNTEHVKFDTLVSMREFNDWQTKPLIFTDETLSMTSDKQFFKVYECLKEIVDVVPKEMRINPKYGKQFSQKVYSSYLMFSNHANAMSIASNDRRFYVIDNPTKPAAPEYFTELNAWINEVDANGVPVWAGHVWRHLQAREVDLQPLVAPVGMTAAKQEMVAASKTPLHVALDAVLDAVPTCVVPYRQIHEALQPLSDMMGIERSALNVRLKHMLRDRASTSRSKYSINSSVAKLWVITHRASRDEDTLFMTKSKHPAKAATEYLEKIRLTDVGALQKAVQDALDEHDIII